MSFKKLLLIFPIAIILAFAGFFLFKKPIGDIFVPKPPVILGFLPYWLIERADKNYDQYFTDLAYFSLTVNPDGTIKKYDKPGELEPGWNALNTRDIKATTLTVFNGDPNEIGALISHASAAANLIFDLTPLMDKFTTINLDLESVQEASPEGQQKMTAFVKNFKENMPWKLSIDVSPADLIHFRLINLNQIAKYADYIVLMTYDFHYAGSKVTGSVSPNSGGGETEEWDTENAIQLALEQTQASKILLGVPLYGYEWETLRPEPNSAVLPGSGQVASNRRISTSSGEFIVYSDEKTGTYHQIFVPNEKSTHGKIDLAKKYHLAGLAFWALGYEGDTILKPLLNYR